MSKVARTFMLNEGDTDKLREIKEHLGFRSMSQVMRGLIEAGYDQLKEIQADINSDEPSIEA